MNSLLDLRSYFRRERYMLFERRLDTIGLTGSVPHIEGMDLEIVGSPGEMDGFIAGDYDFNSCPSLGYLRNALNKKAVIFFVFNKKEYVHSSLLADDSNVASFDPLFHRIALRHAGYIGPCHTNPRFRGKGIYPYVLSTICSHLKNMGALRAFINTKKSNAASLSGIKKAGFGFVSEVDFTKVLLWKLYRRVSVQE